MLKKITALVMLLSMLCICAAFAADDQPWPDMVCGKKLTGKETYLDFSGKNSATPEKLAGIEKLPELKAVDLTGRLRSLEEMQEFHSAYPGIDFYFSFELYGREFDGYEKELDLSNIQVEDLDELRTYLKFMPNLEKLVMCDCGLSNEEMAQLRDELTGIKVVWMLHLKVYDLRTDAEIFTTHRGTPPQARLFDDDVRQLKYCTDLKALDLGHNTIYDISFIEYLPNLTFLILADNPFNDATPIGKLEHLHYCELFMTRINSFAPLANCKELHCLNLSYCSEAGDFEYLYELKNLHRLWLNGVNIRHTPKEEEVIANIPEGCEFYCHQQSESTGFGWRNHEEYDALRDMFDNGVYNPVFDK